MINATLTKLVSLRQREVNRTHVLITWCKGSNSRKVIDLILVLYSIHQLTITIENDTNKWCLNLSLFRRDLTCNRPENICSFLIFSVIKIPIDGIAKSSILIKPLDRDSFADKCRKCLQNGH